jgi:hypothetical protein
MLDAEQFGDAGFHGDFLSGLLPRFFFYLVAAVDVNVNYGLEEMDKRRERPGIVMACRSEAQADVSNGPFFTNCIAAKKEDIAGILLPRLAG